MGRIVCAVQVDLISPIGYYRNEEYMPVLLLYEPQNGS